jgi:hypothetical protein
MGPLLTLIMLMGGLGIDSVQSSLPCSRELSREASSASASLQRLAQVAGLPVSPGCPLQPHLGRFALQEAMKERKKDKHWVCTACGRSFMGQNWIDAHVERRHGGTPAEGLCLADHCPELGCPGLQWEGSGVDSKEEAARMRCRDLLQQCFSLPPPSSAQAGSGALAALHGLCNSTFAERTQRRAREAAQEEAFQWTPLRAAGAVLGLVFFLFLLKAVVEEDIKNPIKGFNARQKEKKAAAAAAAPVKAAAAAPVGTAEAAASAQASSSASVSLEQTEKSLGGGNLDFVQEAGKEEKADEGTSDSGLRLRSARSGRLGLR